MERDRTFIHWIAKRQTNYTLITVKRYLYDERRYQIYAQWERFLIDGEWTPFKRVKYLI